MNSPFWGEDSYRHLTRPLATPTKTTKLTALLLLIAFLQGSAPCRAQRICIKARNKPLTEVLKTIEHKTGLSFFFEHSVLRGIKSITLDVKDMPVEDVLDTLLNSNGLEYEIIKGTIFINAKAAPRESPLAGNVNAKGVVVDEKGEPLAYASVSLKKSRKATMTDNLGMFEIKNIPRDTTLIISFTGYTTKEILAGKELLHVTLLRADSQLDVALVNAYGTTTQRLNTGNIDEVKGTEMERQPVDNPLLALEGRIPGVNVSAADGLAGTGVTIRIEGQNSILNGNDPLYLVDGVPFAAQLLTTSIGSLEGSSGGPTGASGNPFSYLNPGDIESITVLKDADATAIYGSKGANGVILITTKRGKAGDTQFTLNAQQGWGQTARKLPLMNTRQYLGMRREALANDQVSRPDPTDYDLNGVWDTTRYTNWQKTLIGNTARYTNINAGISGGSANTQFLLACTVHRQTAVFPGNFADNKESIYFNFRNTSANGRFTLQLMASFLHDNNQLPQVDLTGQALTLAPDAPALFLPGGQLNWQSTSSGMSTWANPLAYLYKTYQDRGNNLLGDLNLTYHVLTGLDFSLNLAYSGLTTAEFSGNKLEALAPAVAAAQGSNGRSALYSDNSIDTKLIEPQLNWHHGFTFGELRVLAGATYQEQNANGIIFYAYNFVTDDLLRDMHSAASLSTTSSIQSAYRYTGAFCRLGYNWKAKYLLNLTAMRDGSSRFGPDSRFHDFAAVGAGWIFTTGKGLRKILPILSFGKIRASYGTTGNDQIGDYRYLDLYSTVSQGVPYQQIPALAVTNLSNPNLQWEETRKFQVGIDLRFWSNRIMLTANYIRNRSSNQLINLGVPVITGSQIFAANVPATVQNTGLETELSTVNIKEKHFSWTTSFNFTLPANKLIRYYGPLPSSLILDKPLGITRIFESRGVDPATGVYQFLDSHGNLTSTPNPATDLRQLVNTVFPKFYGGIGNSLHYRSVELDIFLQYTEAVTANDVSGQAPGPGERYTNQPLTVQTRWRKSGDITTVERYNSNLSLNPSFSEAQQSTAGFSNSAYLRVKNVAFTWQAPTKMLHRLRVKNLRCFVYGQNLLTITRFAGLDPETGNEVLPLLRLVAAGFQFSI